MLAIVTNRGRWGSLGCPDAGPGDQSGRLVGRKVGNVTHARLLDTEQGKS